MPRFYCPVPLAAGTEIDLPAAVAHHLHVVRLQPGAALTLFDGTGGEYAASLLGVDKRGARAAVLAFEAREAELPAAVTLAQGLPEGSKMDWIVEKAVELGVAALQPLALQRSVVRLSAERADKKLAHWRGVVAAACEQSGRNRLPALAEPAALAAWLGQRPPGALVILSPRAPTSLAAWARATPPCALSLLIGPEGGLTEAEEQAALAHGALALALGPRVLRTETAGLAALAVLGAAWEG